MDANVDVVEVAELPPADEARNENAHPRGPRVVQIAGATLFAISYVPAAFLGATSILAIPFQSGGMMGGGVGSVGGGGGGGTNAFAPLVLPVVGPFIYAALGARDTAWNVDGTTGHRALAVADGIVQGASLAMFIYDVHEQSERARRARQRFSFAPSPIPGGAGVTVAWTQ